MLHSEQQQLSKQNEELLKNNQNAKDTVENIDLHKRISAVKQSIMQLKEQTNIKIDARELEAQADIYEHEQFKQIAEQV